MPDAEPKEQDENEAKEQDDTEMKQDEPEPEANGEGKDAFERPPGCWFWLDSQTYDAPDVENQDQEKNIKKPGDSFKGKNKEGESMDDPEKALKDSRGGPGLNALDQVKADEGDAGTTSKVR